MFGDPNWPKLTPSFLDPCLFYSGENTPGSCLKRISYTWDYFLKNKFPEVGAKSNDMHTCSLK